MAAPAQPRAARQNMHLIKISCSCCGKKFYRRRKEIKKVKRSFCSRSCTAIFNNRKYVINLPINRCRNPLCRKPIPRNRKYCSIAHRINPRKIPPEIYKERIISRIIAFYDFKKRILMKREMYGIYRATRELFGSWNKMITAAGLKPNPVRFGKRQTANDGHICDSFAERIIDDWLYSNNVRHQRNILYPNSSRTVDFLIKGRFVEFLGLNGELKEYDKNTKLKEQLAKKYNLKLIKIYPKDLFPINHLPEIIKI